MNEPPKKQSSPLKYVAIGCGMLGVVGCVIGGLMLAGGGAFLAGSLEAPAQQSKAFFANVRAHDYPGALGRMSPTYQSSHSLASFQQSVEALPALQQHTDDTLSDRNVVNGVATMSGSLTTPRGGVPVVVTLTGGGDAWHIDALVVDGAPLQ